MTPQTALEKRGQMIRDGFCVVDNILSGEFLQELRVESERLICRHTQSDHAVYHGQHLMVSGADSPVVQKLLDSPSTRCALDEMGFDDFEPAKGIIVLTKDPGGPPFYWHQDWYHWNDPISCAPWPQHLFLKYYLTDTALENGCLRVIPGTHCKRIDFHDQLLYGGDIKHGQELEKEHPIMFSERPDQIDVCVKAGSLVMRDARLLHSARRNRTNERRTMLLVWIVRPNTVPAYWSGEIPEPIANRDEKREYPKSQTPGKYLT